MTGTEALTLAAIYGGAAMIQGIVGFGFAVFSVPLVAIIYGPGPAVAMNAVVGTANCGYKAWLLRREATPRHVVRFLGATVAFIPLGVLAITRLPREPAVALIGVFVVAVAVGNLVQRAGVRRAAARPAAFWGFAGVSGILSGAFGAPGPAAVPYFTARDDDPHRAKADLNLYFLLTAPPVVVFHTLAGTVTGAALLRAAWFLPLVLAATWTGTWIARSLPTGLLRRVIDVALLALGIWLVADNLGAGAADRSLRGRSIGPRITHDFHPERTTI